MSDLLDKGKRLERVVSNVCSRAEKVIENPYNYSGRDLQINHLALNAYAKELEKITGGNYPMGDSLLRKVSELAERAIWSLDFRLEEEGLPCLVK